MGKPKTACHQESHTSISEKEANVGPQHLHPYVKSLGYAPVSVSLQN